MGDGSGGPFPCLTRLGEQRGAEMDKFCLGASANPGAAITPSGWPKWDGSTKPEGSQAKTPLYTQRPKKRKM